MENQDMIAMGLLEAAGSPHPVDLKEEYRTEPPKVPSHTPMANLHYIVQAPEIDPVPDSVPVEVHRGPVPAVMGYSDEIISYEMPDGKAVREVIEEMKGKVISLKVAGLDDKDGYKAVKEAKAFIKSVIARVKERHHELKAGVLEWGKKIDTGTRDLKTDLETMFSTLDAETDRIDRLREEKAEEARKEKAAKLQSRIDQLNAIGAPIDIHAIPLFTDVRWDKYIKDTTAQIQAKKEADEKAAAEAKAQAAALEKEKLEGIQQEEARQAAARVEMEARQKVLDAQAADLAAKQKIMDDAKAAQDKADAERKAQEARDKAAQDEADRQAREKALAEQKAAQEAAQAELDRQKAELDAREKEIADKAAADKAAAERKAAEEKRLAEIAAAAPDADKLDAFEKAIRALAVGGMTSDAGIRAGLEIREARDRFCDFVHKKAAALTEYNIPA